MAPLHLSLEFEAMKHDVSNLFKKFALHQSVRFEDFVEEWKKMNFTCVFTCTERNTLNSKRRLTERLLRISSEYLADEVPFLYQVAAIYMLYCVYYKQPGNTKLKIRMTPTMYKDLMEFHNALIEHQHLDAAFVLEKLKNDKAFSFTAFPKYLNFGWNEFMIGTEGMSNFTLPLEVKQYTDDALRPEFTDSLVGMEKEYFALKEKLYKESKPTEKNFLSKMIYYSNPKFPEELSQKINSYKAKRQSLNPLNKLNFLRNTQKPVLSPLHDLSNPSLFENKEKPSKKDTPAKSTSDSRADRLHELKERTFKAKVGKTPHSKRKSNEINEVDKDEPSIKKKSDGSKQEVFYTGGALLVPKVIERKLKNKQTHIKIKVS